MASVIDSTSPRPAQRIDGVGGAGLIGDDLLGAKCNLSVLGGWKGIYLVHCVRVKALCATEDRGERFDGGPHHIVLWLLGGERDPGRLGMKTYLQRALVLGTVSVTHPTRPYPARRPKFGNLFEEVDVSVEEKGQPGSETVDVEAPSGARLDISESVGQREGKLLLGSGPCLAYVITRD